MLDAYSKELRDRLRALSLPRREGVIELGVPVGGTNMEDVDPVLPVGAGEGC